MARVEKATEPSMEEILASIRKIIAEEPAPAGRQSPAPMPPVRSAGATNQSAPDGAQMPAPSRPNVKSDAAAPVRAPASVSKADLDDILGLADPMPAPASVAPAKAMAPPPPVAQPSSSMSAKTPPSLVPSWLFPKTSAAAQGVPGKSEQGLVAPKPFFADAEVPKPVSTPVAQASDFGAVVPSRAPDAAVRLPSPEPVQATAKPMLIEAGAEALAKVEPTTAEKAKLAATAVAKAVNGIDPAPHADAPAKAVLQALAEASPEIRGSRPEVTAAKVEIKDEAKAQPAIIEAPEAKTVVAPAPAAIPMPPLVAGTPSALKDVPAAAIAVAPEPLAGPLPKPVVLADRTGSPAKADLTASDGVRTLEDTVAELLRPMLRQWLDQNMPRIVEKALRVELAESAKSKLPLPNKH